MPNEEATFELVQPAPDPVELVGPDGVFEAFHPNRAPGTDGLGLALPGVLLLLGLEVVRGEEEGGVLASARGPPLPAVLPGVGRHARRPVAFPPFPRFPLFVQ